MNHGDFIVIDSTTGQRADEQKIAATEEWAKELLQFDMAGFVLGEDGELYLTDDTGRMVGVDTTRFKVKFLSGWRVDGLGFPPDKDLEDFRALVVNLDAENELSRAVQVQYLIDRAQRAEKLARELAEASDQVNSVLLKIGTGQEWNVAWDRWRAATKVVSENPLLTLRQFTEADGEEIAEAVQQAMFGFINPGDDADGERPLEPLNNAAVRLQEYIQAAIAGRVLG